MVIISIWALKESGMMPFYILFAGILFLPFILVSILSLLEIEKYEHIIKKGIWTGVLLLLIPSYSLPFFFDWGGIIIALISTGIGIYIWNKRNNIGKQILMFNVVGTGILTSILIIIIYNLIN